MIELTSTDKFIIKQRGTVYTIAALDSDLNPRDLKRTFVRIDGVKHYVLGVETFAIPQPIHAAFGLLVAEGATLHHHDMEARLARLRIEDYPFGSHILHCESCDFQFGPLEVGIGPCPECRGRLLDTKIDEALMIHIVQSELPSREELC